MSKRNAIEFLKNIKWHCEHEEPEGDFISATIDIALEELEVEENKYPVIPTHRDINNNQQNRKIMSKIEDVFCTLGRTKKVEFISKNIDLASADAVAKHVKGYLFDVLNDVEDDEYVAKYLRGKGYEVKKTE